VAGKQGFEPRFHDPESCIRAAYSPCETGMTENVENSCNYSGIMSDSKPKKIILSYHLFLQLERINNLPVSAHVDDCPSFRLSFVEGFVKVADR
jgi:hypothetical protein